MPTYEYTCSACGQDQDIVQAMSDPTLTVCPLCQAEALRKRFTNVGVVFKGSGFYRTDARSANTGKSETTSDSSAPAKSEKKESSTSSTATPSPAPSTSGSTSSTTTKSS